MKICGTRHPISTDKNYSAARNSNQLFFGLEVHSSIAPFPKFASRFDSVDFCRISRVASPFAENSQMAKHPANPDSPDEISRHLRGAPVKNGFPN
jgi:hypothetical protein